MKRPLPRAIPGPSSQTQMAAFVALMLAWVGLTGTQALHGQNNPYGQNPANLATFKNGASVLFSSPLKGGVPANDVLSSPLNSYSFSNNTQHLFMMVIDLGRTYDINTVGLKFSNPTQVMLYTVKTKPQGSASWISEIEGQSPSGFIQSSGSPAFLNGATGQYLIMIFNADPGDFSDLIVTGILSPYKKPPRDIYGNPLNEQPYPYHYFPSVPPASA